MKKVLKKVTILSAALLMLSASNSLADINVSRIAGADRYETALKVNQKYIQKSDGNLAVIASGSDFRTALYGSYLASSLKVPFYVLPKNQGISKSVIKEIDRLNIRRTYIIGSTKILDKSVDNTLKTKGIKVERVFHHSRKNYNGGMSINEIVSDIIKNTFNPYTDGAHNYFIINSNKFPDLLSSIPLYSVNSSNSYSIIDIVHNPPVDFGGGLIIGGENSVPYSYEYSEFDNAFYRLSGNDRYETAVKIASYLESSTIVLVNGKDYPDALASGLVAAYNRGSILLTQPNNLNNDTAEYIKDNPNINKIIIVGGENSVSKNVENELKSLR